MIAGGVQLSLLAALLAGGLRPFPANALAFLSAAQLNFALSQLITWGDRRFRGTPVGRWFRFMAGIGSTAAMNLVVFAAAHTMVGPLPAAAIGIGVAAAGNYLIGDFAVFRDARQPQRRTPWLKASR